MTVCEVPDPESQQGCRIPLSYMKGGSEMKVMVSHQSCVDELAKPVKHDPRYRGRHPSAPDHRPAADKKVLATDRPYQERVIIEVDEVLRYTPDPPDHACNGDTVECGEVLFKAFEYFPVVHYFD